MYIDLFDFANFVFHRNTYMQVFTIQVVIKVFAFACLHQSLWSFCTYKFKKRC